ncbi:MAG: N-acetyltransferase, partial [Vagococcus sp.]
MKYVEEANRFVVYDDQMTEIGEMTWSNAGESMIIIDHTFVEDDQRGQGIAEQLVALGVDYARKNQ